MLMSFLPLLVASLGFAQPALVPPKAEKTAEPAPALQPISESRPKPEAEAKKEDAVQPAVQLVAIMHVMYSGMKEEQEAHVAEVQIGKAARELDLHVIPYEETERFLASEEGKSYRNCFSVKCSAEAGKAQGAGFVVSGVLVRVKKTTKINLQLVGVEKGAILATDKQKLDAKQPVEDPVREGAKRLFEDASKKGGLLLAGAAPTKSGDGKPKDSKAKTGLSDDEKKELESIKETGFFKGELTTIGPLEIIPRSDRVGVVLGYRRLAFTHYLYVSPEVDLRFFPEQSITKEAKLRLGFGIPLNLQIFSGEDSNNDTKLDKFENAGVPRSEDWDHWRDFFKIIRYIQYGRKEDKVYVNVNRFFASSLGHGIIMKRYIPNLDYFNTRVQASVDAYSRYGGGEFYVNDITKANVAGALAFLKPGSFFSKHWMAESFSMGVTYMTDWDAPTWVSTNRQGKDGNYIYEAGQIQAVGGDMELKVVKWPVEKTKVDIKLYTDYTQMIDLGGGFAFGMLGRYNLYTKHRQAFRTRLEFRTHAENFIPSYFDSFYEIMKYRYFSETRPGTSTKVTDYSVPTKLTELRRRSGDWNRYGAYMEFSYALLDYLGITIGFDTANGTDNGNFLAHIEVPATKYFRLTSTYYKTNVNSAKNVFDFHAVNTMFQALARLRPIQLLAFQFGIRKTPQPSYKYFPNIESVWDLKADLDISWEF